MTCLEAEKLVIPYINDRLSIAELEDFMEHIEMCGTAVRNWRSIIWWISA